MRNIVGINMSTHQVNITPDTNLFPTLGNTGYRFSEAIAEFIDNSIDAGSGTKVTIKINLSKEKLTIEDDASGMSKDEFKNSLKLAFVSAKDKQLGEFGLGMKTAAITLGKQFSIYTTSIQKSLGLKYSFDETEWSKRNDWVAEIVEQIKENKNEHGTRIEIQDFKFKFYPNLITNTKKDLAKRYARFISKNIISIVFNAETLKPIEPDLIQFNGKQKNKFEIKLNDKSTITGWYGFLVKRSSKKDYGFSLLKNNRVILENVKFGFSPHPEVALLVGEINLNFVPVTHTKREFLTTAYEYRLAEDKFKKFLEEQKILTTARGITKRENQAKQMKKIKTHLEEVSQNMAQIGSITETPTEIQSSIVLINKDIIEKETLKIKLYGNKYTIIFGIDANGSNKEIAKLTELQEGKIQILINSDFPYYKQVKDYPTYALLILAEYIAKHIVSKDKTKDVFNIRDQILFEIGLANIKEEQKIAKQEKINKLEQQLEKLKKGTVQK